ncbi:hypothetical protein BH10ACT7_BH10ACT7_04930 [soil metagenome]
MKFWYWSQLVALIVVGAAAGALIWWSTARTPQDVLDPIQPGILGIFVLPGLVLSLLVGQLVMWRRGKAVTGIRERRLIIAQFVIADVLIVTGFLPAFWEALAFELLLSAILIGVAISSTVAIASTTARVRRGEPA